MEYQPLHLKIASYNIHSGKNLWMYPTLKSIISFLQEENLDIIGLQEINENNKRGKQVTTVKKNLRMEAHFGENLPLGDGYFGNATFSKYPIVERKYLSLPSSKEPRGLIDTKIKISSCIFSILNTHLGLNKQERMEQIKAIKEYIKTLNQPFILMGDFNTKYIELDDYLVDSASKMRKEHLPTMMLSQNRIDYVFVSKDLEIIKYEVHTVKMSDHFPVVVEVVFSNSSI